MRAVAAAIVVAALATAVAGVAHAGTLQDVKGRKSVACGVNPGLPGFGLRDESGEWRGFDVDYCRAVAAAIFNDPKAVKFIPLTTKERFAALQSGEVDMLAREVAWTMARDTVFGLKFAAVNYYDGQGFMVKKSLGASSALQLGGASVCVQSGTTTELNLADFFKRHDMQYKPVVFEKLDETLAAYDSGRCNVYTTEASGLYAARLTLSNPDDNIVLPEIISKEPLGPVVRQGDDQWFNIVKWVSFALLDAEELGVTSQNVDEMKNSNNQEIRRLLGVDGTFGNDIGLTNDWAANAIKEVGNYGEIFDRNIGAGSALKIVRGLNALWTNGGIQYAPPIR